MGFGSKRNGEGSYKTHTKEELKEIFNDTDIVATLKNQRLKWARHVWMTESQIIRNVTKLKPNKSRPRGKLRQRWENRVKDDVKLLGVLNVKGLATHTETWKKIMEATMGLNDLE